MMLRLHHSQDEVLADLETTSADWKPYRGRGLQAIVWVSAPSAYRRNTLQDWTLP